MTGRGDIGARIERGTIYEQVNPAPGFPAEVVRVLYPAERDGWWWVQYRPRRGEHPPERRVQAVSLLNNQLWRRRLDMEGRDD